ncbi:MAG: sigma-54-dependent Fis family transcriptional regulator [Cyclobacteriaceae bacterium]|nr:sigma-54-dependent Fis family transcriptional regulator [Cyclobacteriaceae bacterium]
MTIKDSEIQSIKQRFGIIGHSTLLNNAVRVAMQVAPTDMSVLITGESGSGKESFSKIIHHLSPKKHGQFIAVNCGSIPEGTIDSELFGHERGSFTGAHEARKGYFEVTNGGTIFLDEIGEMPLGTQARLLRVLENGEFIKVGSSKVQKTDVRVVAATNINLMKNVEDGKFREDLYYRLSTVPIYVPPLRERGDDIELLFRKFASDFAEKYKVKPITLTDDAKNLLLKYRFPGNIRQLKNLVEQISVLSPEVKEIDYIQLQKYLPKDSMLPTLYKMEGTENISERDILYKVLFEMRKDVNDLKKLVLENAVNPTDAAQIVKENAELFDGIEDEIKPTLDSIRVLKPNNAPIEEDEVQDISHVTEDDSLSIEKKEKELIVKALRKNNNKRKYAAQDLGISERTLYRKIKQYELEG